MVIFNDKVHTLLDEDAVENEAANRHGVHRLLVVYLLSTRSVRLESIWEQHGHCASMEVASEFKDILSRDAWPNSCNANFYETGADSVGVHADLEELFEGAYRPITIISLSLGGTRQFELEANRGQGSIERISLRAGDLLAMEEWTQTAIKHAVGRPGRSDEGRQDRINLTWRWLSKHLQGCPLAGHRAASSPPQLPVPTVSPAEVSEHDAAWAHARSA